MFEPIAIGVSIVVIAATIVGYITWVSATLVKLVGLMQEMVDGNDSQAVQIADHEARIRILEG